MSAPKPFNSPDGLIHESPLEKTFHTPIGRFTQKAVGVFSIHVAGENHCGPDHHSPREFSYEVVIEYRQNPLDARGFLLDNMSFAHFFARLGLTVQSCEILTQRCAEYFWHIAPCPKNVTVQVWGVPNHACVSYTIGLD